jgi:glycosyltransferase involved in cell wall biosynthesis
MTKVENDLVSIIVPVKNPNQKLFEKCLKSLYEQTCKNIELIIVCDPSTKIALPDDKVKVVIQKRKHVSGARQDGLEAATGKYIAGIDSDCIAEENWLEQLISSLNEEKKEVAVIGKSHSAEDGTIEDTTQKEYQNWLNHITCNIDNTIYSLTIDSKNYACITEYAKEIGFDQELIAGEDYDFATRIRRKGYLIVYNDKAAVHHYHRQTLKELLKQKFWHGTGYGQNIVKNNIDTELHYQTKQAVLLTIFFLLLPISSLIALTYILVKKIKINKELVVNYLIYWTFVFGTIKGIYKQGGIPFLLQKLKSDLGLDKKERRITLK